MPSAVGDAEQFSATNKKGSLCQKLTFKKSACFQ